MGFLYSLVCFELPGVNVLFLNMALGQNLRYLFSRDYHLFKRLLRVTGGTGF